MTLVVEGLCRYYPIQPSTNKQYLGIRTTARTNTQYQIIRPALTNAQDRGIEAESTNTQYLGIVTERTNTWHQYVALQDGSYD